MEAVLARLRREGPLSLAALFTPPHTRSRLVGLFLAVLELTKGRRVVPEQPQAFGDILLSLAPPVVEPPETEETPGENPG
jgi:segregation and condensation protein A